MSPRVLIGYGLIILSCLLWLAIAVIPFLPFSAAETGGIIAALIIGGEVTFYPGLILIGPEAWQKIKAWFKPQK